MNSIQLTHPFKDKISNADELLLKEDGTVINTINAFCGRMEDLSQKYKDDIDPSKFKGDAFELFGEYMVKAGSADNRIGIYDYSVVSGDDDVGVDGVGIGENKHPATVQFKFRTGNYILTANEDHLSNFLLSSLMDFRVRQEDDKNMLIVTTAMKLDEVSRERMLKGKVRVLAREQLREMFDNRPEWWERFYDSVKASRIGTGVLTPIVLRDFQNEAVEAGMSNQKGKIILPTGTGKTVIEAEIIARTIQQQKKQGNLSPVIKVNSPRILLCFQLFQETHRYLTAKGIEARYMNFNSGNADDDSCVEEIRKTGGVFREIVSTTNSEEAQEAYAKAKIQNLPLIVFSTYHSSERFAEAGIPICLTIHDEAHNLVSTEFCKAAVLKSDASLFFTATEKVTDGEDGLGMNNSEIFGDMIYSKSPKQMIEAGEMIPPHIHKIKAKSGLTVDLNKVERDFEALWASIADGVLEHDKMIKSTSLDPEQIGAKVLVVCRGQQDLIEMVPTKKQTKACKQFDKFRNDHQDIHIYALSSEFGLYMDGKYLPSPVSNIKKHKMLQEIKALKPSDKCIILHVDMIGEGIDVPGITGVMPFRNCEMSKFVQNIGRASRLHPEDRSKVYAGVIQPNDNDRRVEKKWIKPYSWVIIPNFLENSEGFASRFAEIIEKLRDDFGWLPSQNVLIDNPNGLEDEELIDTVNERVKNRPHADSGLREFEHTFESLSPVDKVLADESIIEKEIEISKEFEREMNLAADAAVVKPVKSRDIPDSPVFTLKSKGCDAQAMYRAGVFVVLAGSTMNKTANASCYAPIVEHRNMLIQSGVVKDGLVMQDIPFNSISRATSCVMGSSSISQQTWKNEQYTVGEWIKKSEENSDQSKTS